MAEGVEALQKAIAVYGAGGHTGRFVVGELLRRALPVVTVGRTPFRLPVDLPARTALIDDPASLDRAFAGCGVVINCAGPFLDRPALDVALEVGFKTPSHTSRRGFVASSV